MLNVYCEPDKLVGCRTQTVNSSRRTQQSQWRDLAAHTKNCHFFSCALCCILVRMQISFPGNNGYKSRILNIFYESIHQYILPLEEASDPHPLPKQASMASLSQSFSAFQSSLLTFYWKHATDAPKLQATQRFCRLFLETSLSWP